MIPDNVPPIDSARAARLLLRAHRYGALSTLSQKFGGHPFGSITPYLTDHDGSLVILISDLAEHTKNIKADPRVSLITHNQEDAHIQAQGRVTVIGTAVHIADRDGAGKRYLRYFPEARSYFVMHDFQFYRITPQAIRYIGGFGNIHWINCERYAPAPYPLQQEEEGLLEELNTVRTKAQGHIIGIDCDGYDVREAAGLRRLDFEQALTDAAQVRPLLLTAK